MYKDTYQQGKEKPFHVAEVYSPPRVTAHAWKLGLNPGFALDLTVPDPVDGLPWDFNSQVKRERERERERNNG